jgi:hypothetical protein
LLALAACAGKNEPPPVVVTSPEVADAAAPLIAKLPSEKPAPFRAIVLAGAHAVLDAAWIDGGAAIALTRTELWRFKPDDPEHVRVTPLARPAGTHGVLAAAPSATSTIVAVGLDDGSVDLVRDGVRVRTLPAAAKDFPVLQLRFSTDGKTVAVTRTSDDWLERTVFYDVDSGDARGEIQAGNVVFDEAGRLVAGRGGLYAIDGGKLLYKWREGFFVLGPDGKMIDFANVHHGEVMAGDYVARGFVKGAAYFAGDSQVAVVEMDGASVSKIAASCAPSQKLGSVADTQRGRVIGMCTDGVVVTDIAAQTSARIRFPVQKPGHIFAPKIILSRQTPAFFIEGIGLPAQIVDTSSSSAHLASAAERTAFASDDDEHRCVHKSTARTAMLCENAAERSDGVFVMHAHQGGFSIVRAASGATAVDWGSRTSGPPPRQITSVFVPPAECKDAVLHRTSTSEVVYSSTIPDGPTRYKGTRICRCNAKGCSHVDVMLPESFLEIDENDDTILTSNTNSTQTETQVSLRRPGATPLRVKIPAGCIHGGFGPSGRPFVSCEARERSFLYELSPKDLSVIAKRPTMFHVTEIAHERDDLLLVAAARDSLITLVVQPEWARDETMREKATIYSWAAVAIRETPDGTIAVQGDRDSAAAITRCFDGARLRPLMTCWNSVIRKFRRRDRDARARRRARTTPCRSHARARPPP